MVEIPGAMMEAAQAILQPTRLWRSAEVLLRPCPIPAVPGVYGWYFRSGSVPVPEDRCAETQGMRLLYVGIAPRRTSSAPSRSTLRSRLRMHYRGNAAGSTLRLSLGCLLEPALGTSLQATGSAPRLTFGDAESRLNDWMAANTTIAWAPTATPWDVEAELVGRCDLPLNLDMNAGHAFRDELHAIRAAARLRAISAETVRQQSALAGPTRRAGQ